MARRATKDTYGMEVISGTEVRRVVKAGDVLPGNLVVEEGSFEDFDSPQHPVSAGPYPEVNEQADAAQEESLQATRRLQDEAAKPPSQRQGAQSESQGDQGNRQPRARRTAAGAQGPEENTPSQGE